MLFRSRSQPHSRQHAWVRRDQGSTHPQTLCHATSEQRTGAAERDERHVPRIDPTLDAIVEFRDVSIKMPRHRRRRGGGRRQRLRRFAGEIRRDEIKALVDVSFSVQPGESVAVVGPKGLGRQALLRLAAGTLRPDSGRVSRSVPIVPMIEVARAFARAYSIRQNIYIVGGLLGNQVGSGSGKAVATEIGRAHV